MGILGDRAILDAIDRGEIVIREFDRARLGTNSYDVRLGKKLKVYRDKILDARLDNPVDILEIPDKGLILEPERFYIAATMEHITCHKHVPIIEGKSSSGKLGLDVHLNTSLGDVGFSGHFSPPLRVALPLRIYPGMPFAQIYFLECVGDIMVPYGRKENGGKYQNGFCKDPEPNSSRLHKSFQPTLWDLSADRKI